MLGEVDGKPTYGEYRWKTWGQTCEISENVARAFEAWDLAPTVYEGDKPVKVCGIWAKNREEWLQTQIASWYVNAACSGFYDSMNDAAITYIADETEMTTMFCENKYVRRLIDMKKAGKIQTMVNIINYDNNTDLRDECTAVGMKLFSFIEAQQKGAEVKGSV